MASLNLRPGRLRWRIRPDVAPPEPLPDDPHSVDPPPVDPPPGLDARLLSTVTLLNTADATTATATHLAFGHPFVKGDVPPGRRLKAVWTPHGGAETVVACQTAARASWTDGSLKFAAVAVRLPAVAAKANGVLELWAEPGDADPPLPGGRTVAMVRDDLTTRFPCSVHAANLTHGRETIRVDAGGSGYTDNDQVVYSGGSGGSPPTGSSLWTSDGEVKGIGFTAPETAYTTPPDVRIESASGSGAVLTFLNPPVDGSGHWTWTAAEQLAMLGSTDPAGRVRCEVVESGQICTTFHCWGPFRDDETGASHSHLIIRAWYRCWLDPVTGAIDQVESMHSVEQGWCGNLNDDDVLSDQVVGDFTVALDGVPVLGRSFPRTRIVHYSASPLVAVDDANPNWDTGGSDWTGRRPTLHTRLDAAARRYWRRSGLIFPLDLEYYEARPPRTPPSYDSFQCDYAPGSREGGGMMDSYQKAINSPGDRDSLGPMANWDCLTFLRDDPADVRRSITTALYAATMPISVRNPKTGRIPVLVSAAVFPPQANSGMGANRPETRYLGSFNGNYYSPDMKLRPQAPFVANLNGGYGGDHTGDDGGWGMGQDHFVSLVYYAYLRTAAPWFLETAKVHASAMMIQNQVGPWRLPDGTTIERGWICTSQTRDEAWITRTIVNALAVLPDDAPEKPYLHALHAMNSAAAARQTKALSPAFRNLGAWVFPSTMPPIGPGLANFTGTPWMLSYLAMARAWEYLLLDRPADTRTFLEHFAKSIRGRADPTLNPGAPWCIGAYRTIYGSGDDYFPDWSQMPFDFIDGRQARFDRRTAESGEVLLPLEAFTPNSWVPLQVGDPLLFYPTGYSTESTPDGIDVGRWYYIAAIPEVGRVVLSPNTDGSDPIISYPSITAEADLDCLARLNRVPTPDPSSGLGYFGGGVFNPNGYTAYFMCVLRMLVALGIFDADETWVADCLARYEDSAAVFEGRYDTRPYAFRFTAGLTVAN